MIAALYVICRIRRYYIRDKYSLPRQKNSPIKILVITAGKNHYLQPCGKGYQLKFLKWVATLPASFVVQKYS